MAKLLKDASGIYNLDHVSSIHPIAIKGDKQDQTKVTQTYTSIAMIGGQTHSTTIPYSAASAIALDYWNDGKPQPDAVPPRAPAPAPTDSENLASAQQQYG